MKMILKAAFPQDVMTAASVEEEEDMDLSEEGGRDGEVGIARDDDDVGKDGADEELHPPGEDLNGKQSVGNKKRRKKGSGQLRDEGQEWAQKAQVSVLFRGAEPILEDFLKTFSSYFADVEK